jgi:hypothetical protein
VHLMVVVSNGYRDENTVGAAFGIENSFFLCE